MRLKDKVALVTGAANGIGLETVRLFAREGARLVLVDLDEAAGRAAEEELVDGGADPVSGRHMYEYFTELVPNADAICFDDIGHYPQIEAPQRVLSEVLAFLD